MQSLYSFGVSETSTTGVGATEGVVDDGTASTVPALRSTPTTPLFTGAVSVTTTTAFSKGRRVLKPWGLKRRTVPVRFVVPGIEADVDATGIAAGPVLVAATGIAAILGGRGLGVVCV